MMNYSYNLDKKNRCSNVDEQNKNFKQGLVELILLNQSTHKMLLKRRAYKFAKITIYSER